MKKNSNNIQTLGELLKNESKSSSKSTNINDIKRYVKKGKFSKEIIKEYKMDEKQIDDNLLLLLDYEDDRRECEKCRGMEECSKPHPYFQVELEEYGGFLSRHVGPCPYYKTILRLSKNYLFRQFSPEWNSIDVSNLKPISKRQVNVWKSLQQYINKPNKNWVYVRGEMGSGRSFLTAVYCNTCAKKGQKIAFISCNEMFKQLKDDSIKNHDKFEKDLENIIECDILVMDNFGSEYKTAYCRDTILLPILNGRSNNKKPIIFISDYTLKQIQSLYSIDFQARIISKALYNLIDMNLAGGITVPAGIESRL